MHLQATLCCYIVINSLRIAEVPKRCVVCGQVFLPASNRAKFCPACKQTVVRQQKAASARRARAVER